MSKENETSDKHENGNDFIAYFIKPKDWDLFQWCYANLLWWLFCAGLINLIIWMLS